MRRFCQMLKKTCKNGIVGHPLLKLKAKSLWSWFNKCFYHAVILTHLEAERAPCHTQWSELTGVGRCSLWRSAFWSPTQMSLITSHCFKFPVQQICQHSRLPVCRGCHRSNWGLQGWTKLLYAFCHLFCVIQNWIELFYTFAFIVCHPENWCRGPRTGAGRSQNC